MIRYISVLLAIIGIILLVWRYEGVMSFDVYSFISLFLMIPMFILWFSLVFKDNFLKGDD